MLPTGMKLNFIKLPSCIIFSGFTKTLPNMSWFHIDKGKSLKELTFLYTNKTFGFSFFLTVPFHWEWSFWRKQNVNSPSLFNLTSVFWFVLLLKVYFISCSAMKNQQGSILHSYNQSLFLVFLANTTLI